MADSVPGCDHTLPVWEGVTLPCPNPLCPASPAEARITVEKHYPGGAVEEIEFERCYYETAAQSHFFFWRRA